MKKAVRAVVHNGKIVLLENIELEENTHLLITILTEDIFNSRVDQDDWHHLTIHHHSDNIYDFYNEPGDARISDESLSFYNESNDENFASETDADEPNMGLPGDPTTDAPPPDIIGY